jgi:hypothetical protein
MVPPAPHRDNQIVRAGEVDCVHDIGNAGTASDERGPLIDHAIPHLPRGIILRVAKIEHFAPLACLEFSDSRFRNNGTGWRGLTCHKS